MVEHPNWVESIFYDDELEEVQNNDGWSIGIVVDGDTGEEHRALVEHFDARFPGEVKVYFFDKEFESYAHETEEEYPGDTSFYVSEYTDGYLA